MENTLFKTSRELEFFNKLVDLINEIRKDPEDEESNWNISSEYKIDIIKMFNKLSEEDLNTILNLNDNQILNLAALINKLDFSYASSWLSIFNGYIYGFSKYYKKSGFIKKFPNYKIKL